MMKHNTEILILFSLITKTKMWEEVKHISKINFHVSLTQNKHEKMTSLE